MKYKHQKLQYRSWVNVVIFLHRPSLDPASILHALCKWSYIRWLGHSHFHCYAWQKHWGLVVAGVCMLEEAKQRSLSERLSTDGTLDPKTFSIWTVTHSYDTARGMLSWGLHNTVNTFNQAAHCYSGNISSTENLFNNVTKKKAVCHLQFVSFSYSGPQKHITHTLLTTCFWRIYPP